MDPRKRKRSASIEAGKLEQGLALDPPFTRRGVSSAVLAARSSQPPGIVSIAAPTADLSRTHPGRTELHSGSCLIAPVFPQGRRAERKLAVVSKLSGMPPSSQELPKASSAAQTVEPVEICLLASASPRCAVPPPETVTRSLATSRTVSAHDAITAAPSTLISALASSDCALPTAVLTAGVTPFNRSATAAPMTSHHRTPAATRPTPSALTSALAPSDCALPTAVLTAGVTPFNRSATAAPTTSHHKTPAATRPIRRAPQQGICTSEPSLSPLCVPESERATRTTPSQKMLLAMSASRNISGTNGFNAPVTSPQSSVAGPSSSTPLTSVTPIGTTARVVPITTSPASYSGMRARGNTRVRMPQTPASMRPTQLLQEIRDLRSSQLRLSSQVSKLQSDLLSIKASASETERLVRGPESHADRAFRRTVLFANVEATKALRAKHVEFSRVPQPIVMGNSIQQISLKSKTSNCTLFDFRLLVSSFLRRTDICCSVVPSSAFVLKSSTSRASFFRIEFDRFVDLCSALGIATDHREDNVYKEKLNICGDVRCVQVLGVSVEKLPNSQKPSRNERKVLLGQGMVRDVGESFPPVHALHQRCARWSNNTWDEGFVYVSDTRAMLAGFDMPSASCASVHSSSKRAVSSRRASPQSSFLEDAFAIVWERIPESPSPPDASPEQIPGHIRIIFPAVILRSRILIRSTQDIFARQTNNRSLQAMLCSSAEIDD